MLIRSFRRTDIPQISLLYYETVHRVNSNDYAPRQIRAWAPRVYPDAYWQRRFQHYSVFVAEKEGSVVGFAELARTGDIECFYVHYAWQRGGIGRALMSRIEEAALGNRNRRLRADVSTTAEPFFRRLGFKVTRRQVKVYRNRAFKQAEMEKRLRRTACVP